MATALGYAGVLVVSVALTWWGSDALERAAAALARRYGLPGIVEGSLIVAVGSSSPELTTTIVASAVHDEFELGMASIVGSAVFNILVIPGLAAARAGWVGYDVRLVYRDAQFYLTSVAVLLLTFSFAVVYEPLPGLRLGGELDRGLVAIPLAIYGLYLFLQQQEMTDARRAHSAAPPAAPERPRGDSGESGGDDADRSGAGALRAWATLGGGLMLVILGVEGLLRTAIWLGDTLGTPSFLWGATVVAAATSLPDAIVSIRAAAEGQGDVSIGNVLGSNIFDLLVAIPVGVLVVGTAPIDFRVAAPLMGFLTLATIVLFTAMRTSVCLTRREAVGLLALYAGFVGWLSFETAGWTDLLPSAG
jgi:cation:H+ antiporter